MAHTPEHLLEESTAVAQDAAGAIGGTFEQGVGFSPDSITSSALESTFAPQIATPPPLSVPIIPEIEEVKVEQPVSSFDQDFSQLESAVSDVSSFDREGEVTSRTAPQQRQLTEINKQIRLQQADALQAQEEARERGETRGFQSLEIQKEGRLAAVEAIRLSATAEAIRGNLVLADTLARRAVNEKFRQEEQDIETARQNILKNFDSFTKSEQKQALATLARLDSQDEFVKEQKANDKAIQDIAINAASQGVDNLTLDKISRADSPVEAQSIATEALGVPTETLKTQVVEVGGRKLLINTQTGATIQDLGAADVGGGKEPTGTQRVAAGFALRAEDSNRIITELGEQFTGKGTRLGIVPEAFKSEDRKSIEQAERNFVNAILRRESGAAIAPTEFTSAQKQYFPQVGDTNDILLQKQRNRAVVIQSLKLEAADAFTQLKGSLPPIQQKVTIGNTEYEVGTIIQNSKGDKARVNADGTLTFI